MRRIWFDFNAMNHNGVAWASRQFCDGGLMLNKKGPQVGERVLLYDGEGNSCEGVIRNFHGKWGIVVQTEISTWKDGEVE